VASWDALDIAFSLPDYIPVDSEYRTLFEQLRHRLQSELSHMDLLTYEVLLVERYITNYVVMKYRESLPLGDDEGFITAAMAKDVNAHWLSIAAQVRDLGEKGRDRVKGDLVSKKDTAKRVADVVAGFSDMSEHQKRELLMQIAGEFDRLGV
jgi:hypothetical protein